MTTLIGNADELTRRQWELQLRASCGHFDIHDWTALETAYANQGRICAATACRHRYTGLAHSFAKIAEWEREIDSIVVKEY